MDNLAVNNSESKCVDVLHTKYCKNTDEDIKVMINKLSIDPDSIDQHVYISDIEPRASVLFHAAYKDHDNCFQFLYSNGAEIEGRYENKDIVHFCIEYNSIKTLKYIFDAKIYNPIIKNGNENSYLLSAVKTFEFSLNFDLVNLFLNYGVKIDNFKNYNLSINEYPHCSPVVESLVLGCPKLLKLLLLRGAVVDYRQTGRNDLNVETKNCISLIHNFAMLECSSISGYLDNLYILYQFGANLWEKNRLGFTPLEIRENLQLFQDEFMARGGLVRPGFCDVFTEDMMKITDELHKLMSKPLTLKSSCRVVLWRSCGSEYLQYVESLKGCVPQEVLTFLTGDDLPDSGGDWRYCCQ